MEREQWKQAYIDRMVAHGLTRDFATADYEANADSYDYASDPRDAADDEVYYITQDCDGDAP